MSWRTKERTVSSAQMKRIVSSRGMHSSSLEMRKMEGKTTNSGGNRCTGMCRSSLPFASIFPVKQKGRLSDGGGGFGSLEERENNKIVVGG